MPEPVTRAALDLLITEANFQLQVISVAHYTGWLVAHFRGVRIQRANGSVYYQTPVQADGAGFPDLVLVNERKKRTIFAELKSEKGRVTPDEQAWLDALRAAGQAVFVWRPSQFDEICRILEKE